MKMTLAMLALLTALPTTAALADDECPVPTGQRQSREALTKLTDSFGWTIDKMKIDDGCYKLRIMDVSGNVLKVKIDPATLEVIDGKVISFADDGNTPTGEMNDGATP
ncbi:PepSY domain-containing protein [Mesorhizobium sp. A623]